MTDDGHAACSHVALYAGACPRVSPTLVGRLAKLEKLDPIAKQWAPEFKADGWTVAQTNQALAARVALAVEATAKKQALLLLALL